MKFFISAFLILFGLSQTSSVSHACIPDYSKETIYHVHKQNDDTIELSVGQDETVTFQFEIKGSKVELAYDKQAFEVQTRPGLAPNMKTYTFTVKGMTNSEIVITSVVSGKKSTLIQKVTVTDYSTQRRRGC